MTNQGKKYYLNWADDTGSCEITDCLVVGRSQAILTFADDGLMSDKHAQFNLEGGNLYVIDLESETGTFVNGEQITPKTPVALQAGDSITMGDHHFKIDADDAAMETDIGVREASEISNLLATTESPLTAEAPTAFHAPSQTIAAVTQPLATAAAKPIFSLNPAEEYKRKSARGTRAPRSKKVPFIAGAVSLLVFFIILFSGRKHTVVSEQKVATDVVTETPTNVQTEEVPVEQKVVQVPVTTPTVPTKMVAQKKPENIIAQNKPEKITENAATAKSKAQPAFPAKLAPHAGLATAPLRSNDSKMLAEIRTLSLRYKKETTLKGKLALESSARKIVSAHFKAARAALMTKLKPTASVTGDAAKRRKIYMNNQLRRISMREQSALSRVREYLVRGSIPQPPAPATRYNAR